MSLQHRLLILVLVFGGCTVVEAGLRFEENVGQVDRRVRFLCRADGYTLYLTDHGAVFDSRRSGAASSVRLGFAGASSESRVRGVDPLPGVTHYLKGRDPDGWRTGIRSHRRLVYEDLYDGIDLFFLEQDGRIRFDFVVEPGADPGAIAIDVEHAGAIRLDDSGGLRVDTGGGILSLRAPLVYQIEGNRQSPVAGRFVVEDRDRIRFSVGDHDPELTLVIDPVMTFSTYLGGAEANDEILDLFVDGEGNTYVTGFTSSSDFPVADPFDPTLNSSLDGFVSKLSPDGSTLVWSTFFGGNLDDSFSAAAVAVNDAGEVFLTGETRGGTFPTTAAAFEPQPQGGLDCYVSKLSADGSTLLYSTLLGGSSNDRCRDIAVDADGHAYVAGEANSPNFPTTAGAFLETLQSASDATVTKLSTDGTALTYSTFLGGTAIDRGIGIALVDGEAVVAGDTSSDDFPLAGAFQGARGGATDAFVTRLNAAGNGLVYSSYQGGSANDTAWGVAADELGRVYVGGHTFSSADFPTTAGAFQTTTGGGDDGFLFKVGAGGGLVYSSYLGGSSSDKITAVTVQDDWPRVGGSTTSLDFPTARPIQAENGLGSPPRDAFVTTFSEDGSAILFSTFLGDDSHENGRDQSGIGMGPGGAIHVAGQTGSETFPTTAGSFLDRDPDAPAASTIDSFIVRIDECNVEGLRASADKQELTWAPTDLVQCPDLFDVARGELSSLRSTGGDFSNATCLEDDDVDTSVSDASVPPSGDGFWYLARVDGATWTAAGTFGSRDATLNGCP